MQFLTVTAGSVDLAFISDHTITVPFSFPQPVHRVHAMLQGFDMSFPEDDHHLHRLQLDPQVHFDDRASPTNGELRVHFTFRDDGSGPIATFYARLLLVGE
jgi:hypothetical protein